MLEGRRVIVVGLGKSGVSAAKLCLARGARVIGTDEVPRERLSDEARALAIDIADGGHERVRFDEADLIVVSPGVPRFDGLDRAEAAGIPVIGELELAARHIRAPIVAIGGTNGKSTTTTLVGELLRAGGRRVFVGGNLGTPASEAAAADFDLVVLEVSSFQLERAPTFRPRVSVLLNVTEDHLDRYSSFLAYADAKGNAFINQTSEDLAVVPAGDLECERQARRGRARLAFFGGRGDYGLDRQTIVERWTGERFDLAKTRLFGRHNHENAAAAVACARELALSAPIARKALLEFMPLPHRMALVDSFSGVRFYDDSKATNVGAAVTALRGLTEDKAVLIAGGRDKLGSYEPLVEALAERARAVVVLGEAAERIGEAVGQRVPVKRVDDMQQAVDAAFRLARPGDAVLLSPACSSFDMFRSYAERGDRFAEAVRALGTRQNREVS